MRIFSSKPRMNSPSRGIKDLAVRIARAFAARA
jgi:hypothetical protein